MNLILWAVVTIEPVLGTYLFSNLSASSLNTAHSIESTSSRVNWGKTTKTISWNVCNVLIILTDMWLNSKENSIYIGICSWASFCFGLLSHAYTIWAFLLAALFPWFPLESQTTNDCQEFPLAMSLSVKWDSVPPHFYSGGVLSFFCFIFISVHIIGITWLVLLTICYVSSP